MGVVEVVPARDAVRCALSFDADGHRQGPYRLRLGGPTRIVRWTVPRSARGTWRAVLACRVRGGQVERATGSVVARKAGPARGQFVVSRSLRSLRGSIPALPRPETTAVGAGLPWPSGDVNVDDSRPGFRFTTCDGSNLLSKWRVVGTSYATEVQIQPTAESRLRAANSLTPNQFLAALRRSYGAYVQLWADINRCAVLPRSLTDPMRESLYEQMACHAHYGAALGGNTWDFEAWRQPVDWSTALNPLNRCQGNGWPDYDPFKAPLADFIASLDGTLIRSTADTRDPPKAWLIVGRQTREVVSDDAYVCLIHSGKSLPTVFPSGFMSRYVATDKGDLSAAEACPKPAPAAPPNASGTPATTPAPASGPPTPSGPSPTPADPQPPAPTTYRYAVYGTCADGACGLHRRNGPGYTAYAHVGWLYDNDPVDIACQTAGEFVTPNHGAASNVWDRLADGSYVTDVYITTPASGGAFTASIPRC